MPTLLDNPKATHEVTREGDHVIIKDVAVFMSYDADLDGPAHRDLTEDHIRTVYEKTCQFMQAGVAPQVILSHDDAEREVIGDIVALRLGRLRNSTAIYADIRMSQQNFNEYVESNKYPRRSAEIFKQSNYMGQVSLLGRSAPARPLPDMRFSDESEVCSYTFEQSLDCHSHPGPDNVHIPTDRRNKSMADEKKLLEEKDATISKLQEEIKQLKKNAADTEKDKNAAETERDQLSAKIDDLQKYAETGFRERDKLALQQQVETYRSQGFGVPSQMDAIVERCLNTDKPLDELAFYAAQWPQPGESTRVDTTGSVTPGHNGTQKQDEYSKEERESAAKMVEKGGEFSMRAYREALDEVRKQAMAS